MARARSTRKRTESSIQRLARLQLQEAQAMLKSAGKPPMFSSYSLDRRPRSPMTPRFWWIAVILDWRR